MSVIHYENEVSFRDSVITLLAAINERLSRIEVFIQQKVGDEYPADNRDDWDRARREDAD